MVLEPNGRAPYCPPGAVTAVIDAYRDRGLGTPIDRDVLVRVGVSDTLVNRTLQALVELDLIDESGMPSEPLNLLRQTRGEDEFRARLQEWVQAEYADVLQYANPENDSASRIAEAFRGYEPTGQRLRMATCLIGLWGYAGLPLAEPTKAGGTRQRKPETERANTATAKPGKRTTRGSRNGTGKAETATPSNVLFGVSDEDIAALTETEFEEVWAALGTVARARSRALHQPETPTPKEVGAEE